MKRVVLGLLTFFCLSFSVYAEEVDIIIFTGQSNMVGIGAQGISDDEMNYLNFSLLKGKVYEYKYAEDKIIEYNTSNNIPNKIGEDKSYCQNWYCIASEKNNYALISSFVSEYISLTGRNVVIIPSAVNGRNIDWFQPQNSYEEINESNNIFSFLVKKYNKAVNRLKEDGFTIGNSFYVMYDGEHDSDKNEEKYTKLYMNFHNTLINKSDVEFGAVIEPGLAYIQGDTEYTAPEQEYKLDKYFQNMTLTTNNLFVASSLPILLSQPGEVAKKNMVDRVHLNYDSLRLIGRDAAKNIINQKNLIVGKDNTCISTIGIDERNLY